MTPLTERIIESPYTNRILNGRQIARLLGGSDGRRYGQINRALKAGELVKVRRNLHVVAQRYRDYPAHPYALAQQLLPGSFISAETALSFHKWIPETVHTTLSANHGGKSQVYEHNLFGRFEFRRMTVKPGYFLYGVLRHQLQHQIALIAQPQRALMDMMVLRRQKGRGWVIY